MERALEQVGSIVWPGHTPSAVTRLGGLTNQVYRVDVNGDSLCLRVPGEGTADYINRRNEARASREVARVGVGAPVLYFDETSGLAVTKFIEGATTMSAATFAANDGALARAGAVLRRLHDSDAVFANRFEVFAMIDAYIGLLTARKAEVPEGYHAALEEAGGIRQALDRHPARLAPCHCDPLAENFLDTPSRMWVVDWEYSGMNDPLWDLGDLSVEAELAERDEDILLAAYFGRPPTPAEKGRVVAYKALCDLLWTLWGLVQHADKNPVDDFWAYAERRFGRFKTLMNSAGFAAHIAAVAAG